MNARAIALGMGMGLLAGCAALNPPERPAPLPPAPEVRSGVPGPRAAPVREPSKPAPPPPPQVAVAPPSLPVQPRPAPAAPIVPSAQDVEARELSGLVSYAQRVSTLRPNAQRNVLSAALKEFAREPGLRARLRLALLLSWPGTPISDDARALALLEPVNGAGPDSPVQQFAQLLYAQVEGRVREQKRLGQLKEQLDGLRAIERSLNDRDRAGAR